MRIAALDLASASAAMRMHGASATSTDAAMAAAAEGHIEFNYKSSARPGLYSTVGGVDTDLSLGAEDLFERSLQLLSNGGTTTFEVRLHRTLELRSS